MKKIKLNLQLHSMNPDVLALKKAEIMNKLNQAIKDANDEMFQTAFTEYTDMLQEAVLQEARGYVQASDNNILAGRGARVLTSQETKYYEQVIDAMKSGNPKQALTLIDETLPTTVIDSVFEDILETHPLLNAINFQNTGILTEILVSTLDGRFMATWGQLCDDVVKELTAGTDVINLKQKKLSAFIPICKAMLEIGPTWIDRYVRTILAESIANGLEEAIIDGNGLAEPVGMRRDPNGVLHPQDGYPLLVPIPLGEIDPTTYGGIMAVLAEGPNGLTRAITEVIFIVNPVDYFTKLMPATTVMVNGVWVNDIFPFPTKVIQSVHAPLGEAIIGLAKRYFFGLGTGQGGKIEYSDHYKFLEDDRYYLTKLYGDGKPLDSVSFKRLDISGLKPTYPIVRVTDYADARLSNIELTDELTAAIDIGAFDENIRYYDADVADKTVAGDNNVAVLEVTPKDNAATIAVKLNNVAVNAEVDGSYNVTLVAGQNVIVVTSSINAEAEVYVLVVDYTPIV